MRVPYRTSTSAPALSFQGARVMHALLDRLCVPLGLAGALVACEPLSLPSLPTAPSVLMEGVAIYEHANYEGASSLLNTDVANLWAFKGPCRRDSPAPGTEDVYVFDWNDCVSSIRVAPGWRAVLYADSNFEGASFDVATDIPNLRQVGGGCGGGGVNDCISSIRVFRAR